MNWVSYTKWWTKNSENIPINGGWYKFKSGALKSVYDKFASDPKIGNCITLEIEQFILNTMENKILYMILVLKIT